MAEAESKKPKDIEQRKRSWCITIQEGNIAKGAPDYDNMETFIEEHFTYRYACWCEEKYESGHIHIHLYLELANGVTWKSLVKTFKESHCKQRMGNPSEARRYIEKPDNTYFDKNGKDKGETRSKPIKEMGDWDAYKDITARGNGTDSANPNKALNTKTKLVKYLEEYNTYNEILFADPWFAKMFKAELTELLNQKAKEDLKKRIGKDIIGDNGNIVTVLNRKIYYLYSTDSRIGKTFGIKMKYGQDKVCSINCSTKNAFGRYNGSPVLHLDEFRSSFPLGEMLSITDCYDTELSALYCNKELLADTIIMTTNWGLEDQYKNIQTTVYSDYQAFTNRIVSGVWVMIYDPILDKRYLYCESKECDYTGIAKQLINFKDPPLYCDGRNTIHVVQDRDYYAINMLIISGVATTLENIKAIQLKRGL